MAIEMRPSYKMVPKFEQAMIVAASTGSRHTRLANRFASRAKAIQPGNRRFSVRNYAIPRDAKKPESTFRAARGRQEN
jgi:hypothetical protein